MGHSSTAPCTLAGDEYQTYLEDGETHAADEALYRTKRSVGNAVGA